MSIRRAPTRRRPPLHLQSALLALRQAVLQARNRDDAMLFYDDPVVMPVGSNVIPFPTRIRPVMITEMPINLTEMSITLPPAGTRDAVLVDHDGLTYELAPLIEQLPADYRILLMYEAPRSAQEAWDTVTRRWPTLAACIVVGVGSVAVER